MARPKRTAQPGTFFVTTATWQRMRLFQDPDKARLLIEALKHYRSEGFYKLYAFVIMPDHMHLVITPTKVSLERAIGLIKGGSSHQIYSKFPVWQKGFTDHRLRDLADFEQHIAYTHENPVRAQMVIAADQYPYSSAFEHASRKTSAAEAALVRTKLRHG